MAKVNTLFSKVYLLAGVMMAANMYIVNEMRATDQMDSEEKKNQEISILNNQENATGENINIKDVFYIGPCKYIGFMLQWKNTINFVGGTLFTFANGLYNFYENKPSFYFDWLFAGWNSNPFAKGYLQFCPNINLGRGIFWLVMFYTQDNLMHPYYIKIIKFLLGKGVKNEKAINYFVQSYFFVLFSEYTPFVIGNNLVKNMQKDNRKKNYKFIYLSLILLQNFVSVPLLINLTSKFTISIAFDSIMWMVVTHFVISDKREKKEKEMEAFIKQNVFSANKKNNE